MCESLRKRGMFWLFIHVEQLLCGLVVLAVLVWWIGKTRNAPSAWSRWWPLALTALCMGLLVAAEFAIDGKLFDLPHAVTYAFMCVVLAVIGFCGYKAVRRWNA